MKPLLPHLPRSLTQLKPEVLRQHPGGSGRQFLALDGGYALVATARDPVLYEYAGAMRKATDDGASGKLLLLSQQGWLAGRLASAS